MNLVQQLKRWRLSLRCCLLLGVAFFVLIGGSASRAAIKSDEMVLIYPALARAIPEGWEVDWQGIVYEAESRPVTSLVTRKLFALSSEELSVAEREIFTERSRLFFVDSERRKTIQVTLGTNSWVLGRSGADGRFASRQILRTNLLAGSRLSRGGVARLGMVLEGSGGRVVAADVHLLGDVGISVISDIDDTIKVSDVLNRDALLKNTFCRPFAAVPRMAEVYREWADASGATFHYVSASPWQLYLPLADFVRSNGFPAGTFHMKEFRVKDRTVTELFASPERYKPRVIEPILKRFPRREFVLVGDSGEKDPEIYAALARGYPKQIQRVFIRDVTGESESSARYQEAFRGIPREQWRIFQDAGEIMGAIRPRNGPGNGD